MFDYSNVKVEKMLDFEFEKDRLEHYKKQKKIKVSSSKKDDEKSKPDFENKDLIPLATSPFSADYNTKYGLNTTTEERRDNNDKGETATQNAVAEQEIVTDINLEGIENVA